MRKGKIAVIIKAVASKARIEVHLVTILKVEAVQCLKKY